MMAKDVFSFIYLSYVNMLNTMEILSMWLLSFMLTKCHHYSFVYYLTGILSHFYYR